jgi:LPXTG-motif cell wall-anchored protein
MNRRLAQRLVAGGVAAAAAVLALPPAAQAADPVQATAFLPNVSVAPGGSSQQMVLIAGSGSVHNLKVTFDTSGLPAHVTLSALDDFDDCVTNGDTMICDAIGDADLSRYDSNMQVEIAAATAAAVGDTGNLKVTVESDETKPTTTTSTVRVAEGVNLSAGAQIDASLAPGAHLHAAPTVQNSGATVAHGAVLVTFAEDAFDYATRYSNCVYVAELFEAYCEFDEDLQPGQAYALSEPLDFKVAADSQAPSEVFSDVIWNTTQDWSDERDRLDALGIDQSGPHGTAPALQLVPVKAPAIATKASQTDVDPSDNYSGVLVRVTGRNDADYEALGATVHGAAGSTQTLKVGLKNHGPAAIRETRVGDDSYSMLVTFPSGVTPTVVDDRCTPFANGRLVEDVDPGTPGYHQYGCSDTTKVSSGDTVLISFTVKLNQDLADAKGSVQVGQPTATGDNPGWDDNSSNNTAAIVINPSSGSGSLPVTGSNAIAIGGAGAAAVALGGLLFWLGRRRRSLA